MTTLNDPRLCLSLTAEIDVSAHPQLRSLSQSDHDEAAAVVSETVGLVAAPDLRVLRVYSNDKHLDFDAVHSSPVPAEYRVAPMVIELFYTPDTSRVFGRVCVSLRRVDGVSGLHTLFNVMEHFEHRGSGLAPDVYLTTKPSFTSANRRPDEFDQSKLDAHLAMLSSLSADKAGDSGAAFPLPADTESLPVGPARVALEDSLRPRVYSRFANSSVDFKKFVGLMTSCQERLRLPYCVYTVNYAPSVGLGRLPAISDTLDHEKRVGAQFVPVGAPAPMDLEHATFLSYMLFWNNYGRHNPNITSKVKSVVWNWTGLPKCFTPVAFCTQVQGQCFYSTSFAEKDWEACESIIKSIDGGRPFAECPQPKDSGITSSDDAPMAA